MPLTIDQIVEAINAADPDLTADKLSRVFGKSIILVAIEEKARALARKQQEIDETAVAFDLKADELRQHISEEENALEQEYLRARAKLQEGHALEVSDLDVTRQLTMRELYAQLEKLQAELLELQAQATSEL